MAFTEILPGIHYVGVNDRTTTRFESLWSLPYGVSYNSYLVIDEKVALIDTVEVSFGEQFIDNIRAILKDRPIDYLVVDHMEPDHSATLSELLLRHPETTVVCNDKTAVMIAQFFGKDAVKNIHLVKEGDTLCTGKKHVQFAGIPTFAPEHFARVTQVDTMKRKQFVKGMEQIAQEGAIQIFRDLGSGMEEVIVGVVGVLQLEVLEYRLKNEYNVDIRMQQLPYEHLRWVLNDPDELDIKHLDVTSDTRAIEDMKGNPLLLFGSPWSINWAEQHNETLKLSEFGNLTF